MHTRIARPGTGLLIAVGVLAALLAAWLALAPGDGARAADAEAQSFINLVNQYRQQHGTPPLYQHPGVMGSAEFMAADSAAYCRAFSYTDSQGRYVEDRLADYGVSFSAAAETVPYGYSTGQELWNSYESYGPNNNPVFQWLTGTTYNSIGVGRAIASDSDCANGVFWAIDLAKANGIPNQTTPAVTPPATATATAMPTPVATSAGATTAASPTATPSATSSATPSATPTPVPTFIPPNVNGDADCNGQIDSRDGLQVLRETAGLPAAVFCLDGGGVNCDGRVDTDDVLAILLFVAELPMPAFPAGCAALGSTPAPTPTLVATPLIAGEIERCWLAIVTYDVFYPRTLEGPHTCEGDVPYTCDFQPGNAAACTDNATAPDYDCYAWSGTDAQCTATPGGPDYRCTANASGAACIAPNGDAPDYECAVDGEQVACQPDEAAAAFACTRDGSSFTCTGP